MKEGAYLAVWLFDKAAKALLGLAASDEESRWCVLGVMKLESHIGIWIEIDEVQERESGPTAKILRTWHVRPPTCFIRWDFISHAQLWGTPIPEKKEIGFIPSKSN